MRNQLENILRSEQYLNNELLTLTREKFEKELTINPELKDLTENLRVLKTAVFRKTLRSKIERCSKGGNGWIKILITGSVVITIGAILVWLFNGDLKNKTRFTQPVVADSAYQALDSTNHISKDLSDSTNDIKQAINTFSLGGHELWVQPDIQIFNFESREGATIEGKGGILIIVPENAFCNSSGKLISGNVEFKLVEAFGIDKMVLYKLNTVSNGSLLETGGMFYIDASVNGNKVQINPQRPLYIEIPTINKKERMMAFRGEVGDNGDINWVEPVPLQKYLVKVPLDELDFLPPGFEKEVEGNMPFLNYIYASKSVVDSLYYSLDYLRTEYSTDIILEAQTDKFPIEDSTVPTIQEATSVLLCGIDPISIEAIKKSVFANTFIATKEFEDRVRFLHKAIHGNSLLQIYIDNLDKDLYLSDSLVANATNGELKSRFMKFAKEKFTNVKDAEIYAKRLSDYYQKKRGELKKYHKSLAARLASINSKELNDILSKLNGDPPAEYNINSIIQSTPRPNVATSSVYATPWYGTGWGNIDRYLKILDNGSIEKPIVVSNLPQDTEVTLWLGAVNTYVNLSKSNGQFRAEFPSKNNRDMFSTHVFAISRQADDYYWGLKHFNPYLDSKVEFSMDSVSIEEIRSDLIDVDMTFGRIQSQLEWKEEQTKQLIQYQIENREKQDAWKIKRDKISREYIDELRKQKEIRDVIFKLRNVAFPCQESDMLEEMSDDTQVFGLVENMPHFPGGESERLKFLQKNVRYPNFAKENGISGTVYVTFVVNPDGTISNPQVLRGIGGGCDEEALRVLRMMPLWEPGTLRGKPVSVQLNTVVKFFLN